MLGAIQTPQTTLQTTGSQVQPILTHNFDHTELVGDILLKNGKHLQINSHKFPQIDWNYQILSQSWIPQKHQDPKFVSIKQSLVYDGQHHRL